MKRNLCLLFLILTCLCVHSQDGVRRHFWDIDCSVGVVRSKTQTQSLNIDLGYQPVKTFFFYGMLSAGSLLHYGTTPRTFVPLGDISAGAGLNLVSFDFVPKKPYTMNLRADIGTSMGGDWRYTVYGLRLSLSPAGYFGPTLGFGWRRHASRDDDMDSQSTFYLSAGVRF